MTHSTEPETSRPSVAVVAVIRREDAGRTVYLTQWNLSWRALNLPGGHKLEAESFRDGMIRELGEELDFRLDQDYTLSHSTPTRLTFDAFSDSAWALTAYEFEVFHVELRGNSNLEKLAANPDNHWVTHSEILAGRTNEGVRISPTVARIVAAVSEQ